MTTSCRLYRLSACGVDGSLEGPVPHRQECPVSVWTQESFCSPSIIVFFEELLEDKFLVDHAEVRDQ